MAANNEDIVFYYSAVEDTSDGGTTSAASDSLGGARSDTTAHEIESTLTSAMTRFDRFIDTARIGDGADAHVGKVILGVDGTMELDPLFVTAFDTATGEFVFEAQLATGLGQIGDIYRLFPKPPLFNSLDVAASSQGIIDHRGLHVHQSSGETLTGYFLYLIRFDMPNFTMTVLSDSDASSALNEIEVPTDEPVLPNGIAIREITGGYKAPLSYARSDIPSNSITNMTNNTRRSCWLKRTATAGQRERTRVGAILVAEAIDTTSANVRAGLPIMFDIVGSDFFVTLTADRTTRIRGGAIITATVRSSFTGLRAANVPVFWNFRGPGTFEVVDDSLTDIQGEASAIYKAPADVNRAGESLLIEVKI